MDLSAIFAVYPACEQDQLPRSISSRPPAPVVFLTSPSRRPDAYSRVPHRNAGDPKIRRGRRFCERRRGWYDGSGDRSAQMEDGRVAEPARRLWTLREFLAFDDGTDTRYELFDGQIVAMAPASDVHGALVTRLGRQIGNALRPGCEVIAQAGIVPPERADSWYQANLAVTCAGLTGQQFIAEPILIVEVLSPFDRGHRSRSQAPRLPHDPIAPGHPGGLEHRAADRALPPRRGAAGKSKTCVAPAPCACRRWTSPSTWPSCTRASPDVSRPSSRPGLEQIDRASCSGQSGRRRRMNARPRLENLTPEGR